MANSTDFFSPFITKSITAEYRGMNYIEYADGGIEMYISFQTLLRFISENLNLISNGEGIVSIDWESDKPFYALSCHISTDLTKCYLYNEQLKIENGTNPDPNFATFHPFNLFRDSNLTDVNNTLLKNANIPQGQAQNFAYPQIGNINYIYLNTGYLSQVIADNLDKENKITLRNFLQTVCNDVNRALGGINDLQVVINPDETPNVLTIIDVNQNRIKGLTKVYANNQSYTLIQAQGIGPDNNTQGSFVRSLSAQSQVTPEIASAISIGAQANGNQLGEEATSFSRLSKGLIDRVYPDKIISSPIITGSIKERFPTNLEAFQNLVNNLQGSLTPNSARINLKMSDVNNNGPSITDLFKAIVGEFTIKNQSNPTFIPIKLDIELLGISGIKIFQQFELSSDVLPLSYQNDFNFIITGITHEITTHKWITKLATLTYLKEKDLTAAEKAKIKPIQVLDLDLSSLTPTGVCKTYKLGSNYLKPAYNISLTQLNNSLKAWDLTFGKNYILTDTIGWCAQGVLNTAVNFKNYKEGGTVYTKGNLIKAGGNARDQAYSNRLKLGGWTEQLVGEGLTKAQIQSEINKITYNVGDILVYVSEDSGGNDGKFGHTQIYVGSKSPSGWSSDVKDNYGVNFVYGNTTKYPSQCYSLYLYRVPNLNPPPANSTPLPTL
jgi:hypothetical protein